MPARIPVRIEIIRPARSICQFSSILSPRCLPESWLNKGRHKKTIKSPSSNAKKDKRVDSPINCWMRFFRAAPTTLRIPTSFARVLDRAVARFIKLMLAISKINRAIAENR